MSDAAGPGQQQPSEEEVRAYLAQLRQTPVAEILAQVISVLANGAQVKLGRNDARVLIDTIAAVRDRAGHAMPAELSQEIDQLLGQLRNAQVEGEKEVARLKAEGDLDEQHDVTSGATPQAGSAPSGPEPSGPQPGGQGSSGSDAASRLWVPGR